LSFTTKSKKYETFFLLVLLAAFPPLATDMYLPALPLLQKDWNQPPSAINLTLVGFFISYCFCLLIYGPLSDRIGRKPPLLFGISIFIVASWFCALSLDVTTLIIARVLQAVGAAAAAALCMAMTKDLYATHERVRIFAWMGVIMPLAPAVAPIIGSWMMVWMSWQWIFVCQSAIAIVGLIGVMRIEEPLKERSTTSAVEMLKIYFELLNNRLFVTYALLVSLVALPLFAFIGGSADIYMTHFGLSEQAYGFLFGFNALAVMAGSFLCTRLLRRFTSVHVMTLGFSGVFVGGVFMLLHVFQGPLSLTIPMAIITFFFGLSRPPSNNLALEQVRHDAGAASSLLVFLFFMLGAFSMWLISFDWSDKIQVIGLLTTGVGAIVLAIWLLLNRKQCSIVRAEVAN